MKSAAELKRTERERKRKAGWTLKQIWVRKSKWAAIQDAITVIQGSPK